MFICFTLKNTECPPPQTPQTRCCFRKTVGYRSGSLQDSPLSPFFCFSRVSLHAFCKPVFSAYSGCTDHSCLPTILGTHSISSHLGNLSLRPSEVQGERTWKSVWMVTLIQSARGVKAHRTARPVGNPSSAWLGGDRTQRYPQRRE